MISESDFEIIIGRIRAFSSISEKFVTDLKPLLRKYHFTKTEYLLKTGRKQPFLWFLLEGYAREINLSKESPFGHSSWFWFPLDFVFNNPSYFSNKESLTDIEVLPGATILEINLEDLNFLSKTHSELVPLIEELRFYYDRNRSIHSENLFNLPAKKRYDLFFSEHPLLFNVAKHRDIASFLGIKDIGFRRYFSCSF